MNSIILDKDNKDYFNVKLYIKHNKLYAINTFDIEAEHIEIDLNNDRIEIDLKD